MYDIEGTFLTFYINIIDFKQDARYLVLCTSMKYCYCWQIKEGVSGCVVLQVNSCNFVGLSYDPV